MNYCRNCGKECHSKICPHCGTNARKGVRYCGWCGQEVDMFTVVCPNCHERLVAGVASTLRCILGIIAAAFLFFVAVLALAFEGASGVAVALLLILMGVLLLPATKNLIRRKTFGQKGVRAFLSIVRCILIFALFIGACFAMPETRVTDHEATKAALSVFHEEVHLKDESSFELIDSIVTYEDNYEGDPTRALVTVDLDYTAKNGFGGTNREVYTVELIFDYEEDKYYYIDKIDFEIKY